MEETYIYVAKMMYDTYRESVGGKAYNGYPLPTSTEMWNDPTKTKICRAWEASAQKAIEFLEG